MPLSFRARDTIVLLLISIVTLQQGFDASKTLCRDYDGEANPTATIDTESRNNNARNTDYVSSFDHDLCILTMVRPDGFGIRDCQRHFCRHQIYSQFPRVLHKFVVGIPSYDSRSPSRKVGGELGTEKEQAVSRDILQELEHHNDVIIAPHRDYYMDLPTKRLFTIQWGIQHQCRYTVKIDDEYCLDVNRTLALIRQHERDHPGNELYFGARQWQGTEFPRRMKSVDGTVVPYMGGLANGLSYELSRRIVDPSFYPHAVLTYAHGSSSEDRNVGAWVTEMAHQHNMTVDWRVEPAISHEYSQAVCQERIGTSNTTNFVMRSEK